MSAHADGRPCGNHKSSSTYERLIAKDEYFAAANPATVLRLVAMVRFLAFSAARSRGLFDDPAYWLDTAYVATEKLHGKQHGLSIKEQAFSLWALCRYGDFFKSCPCDLIQDIGDCPFEEDCGEVKDGAWLPILEKRVPPEDQGEGE